MKKTLAFLALGLRLMWRHKRAASFFIAASVCESVAAAATLWLLKNFLDLVSGEQGPNSPGLMLAALAIFAAWMTRALSSCMAKINEQRLLKSVSVASMMELATHLLRQSVGFVESNSRADLIQAVRTDVETMYQSVRSVCIVTSNFATAASLTATAFMLSPKLSSVALLVIPLLTLPMMMLGGRMLDVARKQRQVGYDLTDHLLELCEGLRLVKLYKSERTELVRFKQIAEQFYDAALRGTSYQAMAGVLLEAVAGTGLVLVIVMGGYEVDSGRLSWPALLTFIMALTSLFEPARKTAHIYAAIQQFTPGLERIGDLMNHAPDIADRPGARALPHPPKRITLENVSFSYGQEQVLRDVNLDIRGGEVIGVVGPSGAGKSTLIAMLMRFHDPSRGRICFDGVDIRDIELSSLYDTVSAVLQSPFVFRTTVRENIRYGRLDATDEQVEQAARDANLHDEIMALPRGYDTFLGPGIDLSGGQRQRLNIARALLKDAPILLLDEATSALDSVSEVRIQQAFDRLLRSRTVIAVAHRLSTLRCADRIVVLRDGRVEAVGRHEELLGTSPTYLNLCTHQFVSLDVEPAAVA